MSAEMLQEYDPLRDKSYQLTRLGEPIVDYLASKKSLGRSVITLDDKERYLASFALMWPNIGLAEAETRHCEHWIAQQPAGETRRTRRSHLNDFFRWAVRRDMLVKNPLDRLEQQSRKKATVHDVFSEAEVAALTSLPALDGTLMLVLFDTGLRRSEAVRLQPRHIIVPLVEDDQEPRVQLRILKGKGDKDRLVDTTLRLSRRLAEYQLVEGMGPKDYFWYTRPGGHGIRRTVEMGEASWQAWFCRCLKEADVPKRERTPHTTRHTYATNWLRNGGRLETLSKQLGHESIKTTADLYAHLDRRDILRDLELIEG